MLTAMQINTWTPCIPPTKIFLWHQTKIQLTIALFLNSFCMFEWGQHANLIYICLNSIVSQGNAHRYANIGIGAMGIQPKPSFGIKLK